MATPDGFRFRLQSVLEYRTSLVNRARLELAALQARVRAEEATLDELRDAERAALLRLRDIHSGGPLDMLEIARLEQYGEYIASRIVEQREVLERRRREADAQQGLLIGLTKEAKAIEKLRERQHHEFSREEVRRERIETSEIAAIRHQRLQGSHP
ncbi:MAG: flagellar export protein FliJ [Chloroflexi bacterium]|nr:flagellar export protein FliJ [Chloroflexota bacterium]